jgi:hypothetical protein
MNLNTKSLSTRQAPGITFRVAEVERATTPRPEVPYVEALQAALGESGGALEAYSRDTRPLVFPRPNRIEEPVHAFIHACNLAYDHHHPLTLSPDMIWLLIAQGFALHVNANAEALRCRFVTHEGNAQIMVVRDEFVRGLAGNDWEGVFAEFSAQIKSHIGERAHSLIVREFSTTGIVEKAAFEVTLMDAVQRYFDYRLLTRCGIPEITLEGTTEDWEAVRAGAAALADYDLAWWTDNLLPVLDQFVAACGGTIDSAFWENFYKLSGMSGGPYVQGHVVNLFPYLVDPPRGESTFLRRMASQLEQSGLSLEAALKRIGVADSQDERKPPRRNMNLGWKEPSPDASLSQHFEGITTINLPPALSVAPFTWEYIGEKLPMEFVAGFVGVTQDAATLALRPEIGWAVRERGRG